MARLSHTRRIDGRRYTNVDAAASRGFRRRLDRRSDAVHVCDTDPPMESLDPLLPYAENIQYLIVTDQSVSSIHALRHFTALRELDLFPSAMAVGGLDLRLAPRLQVLAVEGSITLSLAGSSSLRSLLVEGLREADVRQVEALPALRHLRLGRPARLPTEFATPDLESLDISGYLWPTSQPEMRGIGKLRRITLTGIRGLTDLSAFREARSLQMVTVDDCPDFRSITGAGISPEATIRLIGNTPGRDLKRR